MQVTMHPCPNASQVTVHANAAGRVYAYNSETKKSRWLKRCSSGGADDWDVYTNTQGKEFIGSPSNAAKPIWVTDVFNDRQRKVAATRPRSPTPTSDDDDAGIKRNKTNHAEALLQSPNTKAGSPLMTPAKLDFCDDNLKGGKNEVDDKKKIEGKGGDCSDDDPTLSRGADEKTKGGEKSEQSPHSDAEALAAPAAPATAALAAPVMAKTCERVRPKIIIPAAPSLL